MLPWDHRTERFGQEHVAQNNRRSCEADLGYSDRRWEGFGHCSSWVPGLILNFTGRENVFLNAAILGFTDAETRTRMPSIEKFAEIGEFVDLPVKTYSTGMFVRLAFAVAIHMDPDILVIDEALSVGDFYFQQRCMRRIQQLKSQGVTIVFVSHDVEASSEPGRQRRMARSRPGDSRRPT